MTWSRVSAKVPHLLQHVNVVTRCIFSFGDLVEVIEGGVCGSVRDVARCDGRRL
jgi:hypothetical protein